MATRIGLGTKLDAGGDPFDVYVVERIRREGEALLLDVRTERQRCFPRSLTGVTTWTAAYVRKQVDAQKMRVLP